ncbi:hypothetical protein [Paenibacillus beijingensis]|uniref:Uncharacterized protein n=1 Tax=Paenibacillus beijingensis TaxID=1126833 RepID=A0A0D5NN76_9BACL|nr:hypothetical protein [Paenibacillus beijingensis]AJY76754.1 hypothetical protein VN24_22020 [Paenibacillus beijingensis]
MFRYVPVWISSIHHLKRWNNLIVNRIDVRRASVPKIRTFLRYKPLPYYSRGDLTLNERELKYKAEVLAEGTLMCCYNLDEKLAFSIPYKDIKALERYPYGDIDWIRIKSGKATMTYDLLMAFGGSGLAPANRAVRTDEMYDILKRGGN